MPTASSLSLPPEDNNNDVGPIEPPKYAEPDMICHIGATPGQAYVTVAAGDKINLKWSSWPDSHHAPVIDYLANCNGECTTVDVTQLQFTKIAELDLLDDSTPPGHWGRGQTSGSWCELEGNGSRLYSSR
ncbi:MAG: hypothetical protein Q9170_003595 [Blastenia crenularia]